MPASMLGFLVKCANSMDSEYTDVCLLEEFDRVKMGNC